MPNNCAVYGCLNRKAKTIGSGIRYFRFPRKEELRNKWAHLCGRADNINADNAVICSVHFHDSDYKDDMKSRLLGIESPKGQRVLKDGALPSLALPAG